MAELSAPISEETTRPFGIRCRAHAPVPDADGDRLADPCVDPDLSRRQSAAATGEGEPDQRQDRRLHVCELCRGLCAAALCAGVHQLAAARRLCRLAAGADRRAARLGGVAHRHAVPRSRARHGDRLVPDPAVRRRDRLDPARRAECRLDQPHLHGDHRRLVRAVQHLHVLRPRAGHLALRVPAGLCVLEVGARSRVDRDGGGGRDPGLGTCEHHAAHHPAAGAAGDPRQPVHRLSRGAGPLRHRSADRHSRPASTS